MNHTELLNHLIKSRDYESYLEIGVYDGINFNSIECTNKSCCDPCVCDVHCCCDVTYRMTSDEMFATLDDDVKFDIVFIDGMHDEAYVDRDIMNSMKHLNVGGVVCLHDTCPPGEYTTKKYDTYADDRGTWCGDVYKSVLKLYETNACYHTILNHDCGLTVIEYCENFDTDLSDVHTTYCYDDVFDGYNTFTELGEKLMHPITVFDFKEKYKID